MKQPNIGSRIRLLRIYKELTQENVAEMLNYTQSAYSKIERGERQISLAMLDKIATEFDIDLTRLIAYCKGTVSLSDMIREMEQSQPM